MEDLFNLSIKLEEREKVLANAEAEVGSGIRRVFLLEGEAEKSKEKESQKEKEEEDESQLLDDTQYAASIFL